MTLYRVNDVFVPGGLPRHTYVPRESRGLEEHLRTTQDNLCKIATVTGATKSGKTVLVRKVFSGIPHVWMDGGGIRTVDDFWHLVADQLGLPSQLDRANRKSSTSEMGASAGAQGSFLVAKVDGKFEVSLAEQRESSQSERLELAVPVRAQSALRRDRTPLIIDDFHYIPREVQGAITRVLKPLVFEGVPVVYLAIPHRRFDAVKVEREMNGRVENVAVPMWDEAELTKISQLGFPLLNIAPHFDTSLMLAREAHGSPHLMQEFCRRICNLSGLQESSTQALIIRPTFEYSKIFTQVAADLGRNIFDKLARGPRPRTDRLQRRLKNGKTADIYRVVLMALAELKPSVATIEYEPLRTAIRTILDGNLPEAHEVSRVLEQMARIGATDESSVPVIDYERDERRLHITDPFFAFFLKWGRAVIDT